MYIYIYIYNTLNNREAENLLYRYVLFMFSEQNVSVLSEIKYFKMTPAWPSRSPKYESRYWDRNSCDKFFDYLFFQ